MYVKIHSNSEVNTITMRCSRKAKQVTKTFLFYLLGSCMNRNAERVGGEVGIEKEVDALRNFVC